LLRFAEIDSKRQIAGSVGRGCDGKQQAVGSAHPSARVDRRIDLLHGPFLPRNYRRLLRGTVAACAAIKNVFGFARLLPRLYDSFSFSSQEHSHSLSLS
jgi:predicted glycosyltransferase